MGRRRKKNIEQEHHDRWVVSYADFITLLFAFFVVMYSISSVNEGKYRVLSQTLTDAFQEPKRSLNPIQIGELTRGDGQVVDKRGKCPDRNAGERFHAKRRNRLSIGNWLK